MRTFQKGFALAIGVWALSGRFAFASASGATPDAGFANASTVSCNFCPFPPPANEPKGIYTFFIHGPTILHAQEVAYRDKGTTGLPPYPNPGLQPDPTDKVLVRYFEALLDDKAISGIAPLIGWVDLNPTKEDEYTWNYLDDAFKAVNHWNSSHPTERPKTLQLMVSPGIQSPPWLFDELRSCDGLFMSLSPSEPVAHDCGYTTLFFEGEGASPQQIPLPMPWNSRYQAAWRKFLVALNKRIHEIDPDHRFVSIDIAGPTSASTEMILPFQNNQPAVLTLPGGVPTRTSLDVVTAWNILLGNFYGPESGFLNSDLAFLAAWDAAIDTYGEVFSGITLVLETTPDALPYFATTDAALTIPAEGFEQDCGGVPIGSNANPTCAVVTNILNHFVNPTVGGNNAKLTQESEFTASEAYTDLGIYGVKWLAADTAGGVTPLAGTPYLMAPILAGLQTGPGFSAERSVQAAGCPQYPTVCSGLTPEQGLYNLLAHYFDGTISGIFYPGDPPLSGSDGVAGFGNFNYADAPMRVLQIWDTDVLYVRGLSACTMLDITGDPNAEPPVPPDTSKCRIAKPVLGGIDQTAEQMLQTAHQEILYQSEQ